MEIAIDLADFRAAASTAGKINGNNQHLDFGPIKRIADSLETLTANEETFLQVDPVTRCLLRGGGNRLAKKFDDDRKLFHLLREMLGNVRNIESLDETRRSRTIKFFEGVACL